MSVVYNEFVSRVSKLSHEILTIFIRNLTITKEFHKKRVKTYGRTKNYKENKREAAKWMPMQHKMPSKVGRAAARKVHFRLPVSFFMVSRVVEQGQCMREKVMVQMAVTQVQP